MCRGSDGDGQGCAQPRRELRVTFGVSGCHLEDYPCPCALCGFSLGKVLFHLSQALQGVRNILWAPASFAPVGRSIHTLDEQVEPEGCRITSGTWLGPHHTSWSAPDGVSHSLFPPGAPATSREPLVIFGSHPMYQKGDPDLPLSEFPVCHVFAGCWFRATEGRE